jgi:outer membrane protein OmpA-like peptidoglycan-associated protein
MDMKGIYLLSKKIGLTFLTLLMGVSMLWANNGDENYFDYLPKYRKFKSHYQIDKIEYRDKRTIIYFRFVAQKDGAVSFYSGAHPNSWYLRTPPRMRGIEVQFKLLEIKDIRVNNDLRLTALTNVPEVDYEMTRGDVITCEMHFVRIPHYIRMIDLIQGEDGDMDQDRLNCFDILVKTKGSPILGNKESAKQTASRFEAAFPYIKPKVKETALSAAEKANQAKMEADAKENGKKPFKNVIDDGSNNKPIDYIPNSMNSMQDLECSKRVTLPSVLFKEDEVKFDGRVRAMQDIKVLKRYLDYYPYAKLRLHGHTDVHGDDFKNLELSRERALAVKLALVKMGIDRDRIEVLFYGGRQPLKGMEKGSDRNRRVEAEPVCNTKNSEG